MDEPRHRVLRCANCHTVVDPAASNVACPHCGHTGRANEVSFGSNLSLTGEMTAVRPPNPATGTGEALRKEGPGTASAAADDLGGGEVSYAGLGAPARNEEGASKTGQLLRQRLVADGEREWRSVEVVNDQDHDVRLMSDLAALPVQVTRAPIDDHLRRLAQHRFAGDTVTLDHIANALWDAIAKKARNSPRVQRGQLVLAIDAREAVAVETLSSVVTRFRDHYEKEVRSLGYRSVWVVGPVVDLVRRLDASAVGGSA